MKKLPKKFRGAEVTRGLGMKSNELDELIEKKSLDQFIASEETFLVIEDKALEDEFGTVVKCFLDQDAAVRYARAMSNGNVDHRVLRVSSQVLVVGTNNEL